MHFKRYNVVICLLWALCMVKLVLTFNCSSNDVTSLSEKVFSGSQLDEDEMCEMCDCHGGKKPGEVTILKCECFNVTSRIAIHQLQDRYINHM